ncbi:hypothetical protein MASR2M16_08590 [Thauera terpenica]
MRLSYAYAYASEDERVEEIQAWIGENAQKKNITFAYNRGISSWISMIQGDFSTAEKMLRDAVARADEKSGRRSIPACAMAGYLAELLYEKNELHDLESLLAGRLDVMNRMIFFESFVRAYVAGAADSILHDQAVQRHDLAD